MTEGEKRCGLSSFLPMSCRGRAEAFARRLHSRLRSLGSQDGDHTSENSWLTANEIPATVVTSLQPRHSLDHDSFMDFAMFDATGSPEETELTEPELSKFITNPADDLHPNLEKCVVGKRNSLDSDSSDGVYYDPENIENDSGLINNLVNGRMHSSESKIDATDNSDSTVNSLSRNISDPSAESGSSNHKSPISRDSETSLSTDKFQGHSSRDQIDVTDNSDSTLYNLSRNISNPSAEYTSFNKSEVCRDSEASLSADKLQCHSSRDQIDTTDNSDSTVYTLSRNISEPNASSNLKSEISRDFTATDKYQSLSSQNISDLKTASTNNSSITRNISDASFECIDHDSEYKPDTNSEPFTCFHDRTFRNLSEEPVLLSLEYEFSTTSDEASPDNILSQNNLPSSENHDSGISQDTNMDQTSYSSKSTLSPNLSEELLALLSECVTPNHEFIGTESKNGLNHESTSPVKSVDSDSTLSRNTSEDISSEYTSSPEFIPNRNKFTNLACSTRHIIEEPTTLSLDYNESSNGDTISYQAKFPSDSTLSSLSRNQSEEPIASASSNRDVLNFPSFPSQNTLSGLSRNISEDPIFQSSDITISSISRSEDEVPPSQSSECTMSSLSPSEYGTPLASLSDFVTQPPKPDLFENTSGWSLKYEPKIPNNDNLYSAIDLESLKSCSKPEETYCSQLNIQHNLTVECPNPVVEITTLEIPEAIKPNHVGIEDKLLLQVLDDEIYDLERMPRIRRCSSLKTGKTPPGTPGRKKIVRFADVLGLDLADVRTFLDEIPKIPTSAYDDLSDLDLSLSSDTSNCLTPAINPKTLVALFEQPGGEPCFLDKVRERQVCLENAVLQDPATLCICGTIRVRNLDFNKSVHLRYTTDAWKNFADLQATYIENSCDGFSDKFSFTLFAHTLTVGQRLEFAVRFQCHGIQYWDNNAGANYCFQCLPTKTNLYLPLNGPDENNWAGAAFY